MEGTNIVKSTFGKTSSFFLKLAAISTAALAVVNVYSFYRNNIWHPKVVINSIDYANGVANLTINGKRFVLRGDSLFLIDFDWGIKFGFTFLPDGKRMYDRIEITKRGMVHEVLRQTETPSTLAFTGFSEENYWNDAFNQFPSYTPTDSVKR
jgi:hypothetical protein